MDKIDEVLTRGVEQVLPSKKALSDLMSKRKITLYQGFDPSAPSLHLGNYVGLMKLRAFQKLGHKIIFLVGDFTGMIGDPDKVSARKMLTHKKVKENSLKFKYQASRIINFDGNNPAEIKFNSNWNFKLTFKDLIGITSKLTVQQIIERDMFQKRIKENRPIYLHEFLYPVAQGYDSVVMDIDLEIGGNDQLFNMLVGRTLMKGLVEKEKFVLATKLLVDKEGNKAGKTTGNALFLNSPPEEFFGGIMSFPDELIESGFELLTEVDLTRISEKVKSDPMGEKKRLAYEVVKIIWGETDAQKAQNHFEKTFQNQEFSPNATPSPASETLIDTIDYSQRIESRSKIKRLLRDGAVKVNDNTIRDPYYLITGGEKIKIGKNIFIEVT